MSNALSPTDLYLLGFGAATCCVCPARLADLSPLSRNPPLGLGVRVFCCRSDSVPFWNARSRRLDPLSSRGSSALPSPSVFPPPSCRTASFAFLAYSSSSPPPSSARLLTFPPFPSPLLSPPLSLFVEPLSLVICVAACDSCSKWTCSKWSELVSSNKSLYTPNFALRQSLAVS